MAGVKDKDRVLRVHTLASIITHYCRGCQDNHSQKNMILYKDIWWCKSCYKTIIYVYKGDIGKIIKLGADGKPVHSHTHKQVFKNVDIDGRAKNFEW